MFDCFFYAIVKGIFQERLVFFLRTHPVGTKAPTQSVPACHALITFYCPQLKSEINGNLFLLVLI
jgi:hypothetical protein